MVRVWKGTLRATKNFEEIGKDPTALFEWLAPVYQTQMDHYYGLLIGHMDGYTPQQTFDIWTHELGALSTVLSQPKTGWQLADILFDGNEHTLFQYYLDILRPLIEAGLVCATKGKSTIDTSGMVFERTALFA